MFNTTETTLRSDRIETIMTRYERLAAQVGYFSSKPSRFFKRYLAWKGALHRAFEAEMVELVAHERTAEAPVALAA